jgi:branched-subunit amino acid aminotransferase/4-amino-4-deoxychorismate lyase
MAVAWIDDPPPDGTWGDPDRLCLPLGDRGLLLADGLFETVLIEAGEPRLLAEHLERWRQAADLLDMAPPPSAERVRPLLETAIRRSGIRDGALRLNWTRGSGARGLEGPAPGAAPARHRFWLQLSPARPVFEPLTVIISRLERRNASSRLSGCKTFAYGGSLQARREALAAGAQDALLLSTAGGLCCGTSANLLVHRAGVWVTPPLSTGCLPGVMRAQALRAGVAREEPLEARDLLAAQGALLINSLGCRPIRCCDGHDLELPQDDPETLWRRLRR